MLCFTRLATSRLNWQLTVQNTQSKHKYLFVKEISYMFRLKHIAITMLIVKTK